MSKTALLFIIAAALFITTTIHASDNRLINGGFEASSENWKTNSSNVTFDILNSPVKEGTQSAHIINSSATSSGIEQIIENIIPDQKYQISGYVSAGDPSAQKAFIRVAWYRSTDGTGSQISTHDSPMLSDLTGWQLLEFFPNAPTTAKSAKLRLLTANGGAIFDDIHFEVYIEPTITLSPSTTSVPSTPTPTTSSDNFSHDNIYISEVMPAPDPGNPEWIEIYNANDFDVTLIDWYIDDAANGGSSPKKFTITILKKNYASIDFTSTIFNNSGDSARLLDFSEVEKDYISYDEAESDYSFGRNNFSNHDVCSQVPTKSGVNGSCAITDEEQVETTSNQGTIKSLTPTKFLTKKIPTKNPLSYSDDFKTKTKTASVKNVDEENDETVLGESITIDNNSDQMSPIASLSMLSMSYSILSIVSLCVKIALA